MDKRPKKNVRATGQVEAALIQRFYRMYKMRKAFLLRSWLSVTIANVTQHPH